MRKICLAVPGTMIHIWDFTVHERSADKGLRKDTIRDHYTNIASGRMNGKVPATELYMLISVVS